LFPRLLNIKISIQNSGEYGNLKTEEPQKRHECDSNEASTTGGGRTSQG
jgi:hypothetical protein